MFNVLDNKVHTYSHVYLQYAVKRINFQGQESERTQALREAELLSKVRHGHILNYIESFEDDECLNIVTEYCDGGDLEVYLRNRNGKSLPEVRVCHWMFQIASGLQVGYFFYLIHFRKGTCTDGKLHVVAFVLGKNVIF